MTYRSGSIAISIYIGLLALPVPILAASTPTAGFAQNSIWASKSTIVSGDAIRFYTVLYNSDASAVSGNVTFFVDKDSVGTSQFEVAAGDTKILSVPWTASAGTHTAFAKITDSKQPLNNVSDTITLTVAPPPPPSQTAQAASAATNIAQEVTPRVKGAASSTVAITENVRKNAANALAKQLHVPSGKTLGAFNYSAGTTPDESLFAKLWRYALITLYSICNIQILFYIALLVVLYLLWKLVRTIFSERG